MGLGCEELQAPRVGLSVAEALADPHFVVPIAHVPCAAVLLELWDMSPSFDVAFVRYADALVADRDRAHRAPDPRTHPLKELTLQMIGKRWPNVLILEQLALRHPNEELPKSHTISTWRSRARTSYETAMTA